MVNGSDIFPIEIKSGMTITRDYFKGLNHFAKVFPDQITRGSGLVYGGEAAQKRTGNPSCGIKWLYLLQFIFKLLMCFPKVSRILRIEPKLR